MTRQHVFGTLIALSIAAFGLTGCQSSSTADHDVRVYSSDADSMDNRDLGNGNTWENQANPESEFGDYRQDAYINSPD